MNSKIALLIATMVCGALLASIAAFNYHVDPMCYYHCESLDLNKRTVNFFYQVAQKALAHPETELAILGSSRGQTTSPLWIEKKTGLKTLNLSIGAAELEAKLAFLNAALKYDRIKKVIWFADYFELVPQTIDAKIKTTPALQPFLQGTGQNRSLSSSFNGYLKLIDHNTLEASYYSLKRASEYKLDKGVGQDINTDKCTSPAFKGDRTEAQLQKEIGTSYDTYTRHVINNPQNENSWNTFNQKLKELSAQNIEVDIIIAPYNPTFAERLKAEYPEILDRHHRWVERLKNISLKHVTTYNFFDGIAQDDKSPRYWNDGVHFTCLGSILMLNEVFKSKNLSGTNR